MKLAWFGVLLAASSVFGDLYLHVPRGSNNRLNEASANRKNANRLFDSQNNNRGGYNVGDESDQKSGGDEAKQYRMKYFESAQESGPSFLTVEWTNQHGCGGNEDRDPHKLNCNMVLQYRCQDNVNSATGNDGQKHITMRNGGVTGTNTYTKPAQNENKQAALVRRRKVELNKGLQEPWEWYDKCYVRERNKGLFTADQILKNNNGLGDSSAIYTRQNPNGNRNGYECPEERDYFPYWHPTPWTDIAVLTDNVSICNSHFREKSFNVKPYHECIEFWSPNDRKWYSPWNNEADCQTNGGLWVELHSFLEVDEASSRAACQKKNGKGVIYKWGIPYNTDDGVTEKCLVAPPGPECSQAPWTRSNHLGNGREGLAATYTWTLPHFPSNQDKRCVFRMRYNITTDDYDPFQTDSSHNQDPGAGQQSPVQQNPYVEIGVDTPLRLAINTAQFGRTFQDRSHVFLIRQRPAGVNNERIFNLNVRGKRGNIVQVYPAVEYDFAPNKLELSPSDLVHIQWTGSNSHNNGNPAGDGQAGDAGEGRGGTDRSNIVQVHNLNENFPLPMEQTTMWNQSEIIWIHHGHKEVKPEDLAVSMASAGYFQCLKANPCHSPGQSAQNKGQLNNQLDNAPASYEGALLRFRSGEYHYICTRNNNFTNRSQKAAIIVK